MTEKQAERAWGREIELERIVEGSNCRQGRMGPAVVLVTNGRVAVVETAKRSRIRTPSGIRVGDTRATLKRVYRGRLHSRPAPLSVGYTIYEVRDGNRELQFLVRNGGRRVLTMSVGRRPEVDYSEGCA